MTNHYFLNEFIVYNNFSHCFLFKKINKPRLKSLPSSAKVEMEELP